MKKGVILAITLLIVSIGTYTVFADKTPQNASETASEQIETKPTVEELLRLVNAERAKVGVKPLKLDEIVQKSAQLKADDMVKRNYFSHEVKGTNKVLTPEMDNLLSGACLDSSENIFWAKYDKSQTAVDWWMNSKPHRETMLSDRYEAIGFGISDWRVVAHFCDAN